MIHSSWTSERCWKFNEVFDYVSVVVVAELTDSLIMDDMKVDKKKARKIRKESAAIGDFAGGAGGAADDLVRDGFLGGPDGDGDGDDGGWLRTGGSSEKEQERMRGEVKAMSESGQLGDARPDTGVDEEESIPDMEDDDDDGEAIIREKGQGKGTTA